MSGFFAVLQDGDSSSDDSGLVASSNSQSDEKKHGAQQSDIVVPSYEDLSSVRVDEETVLSAVYGSDFSVEEGAWGCKRLNVLVKPPDVVQEQIGNQLV